MKPSISELRHRMSNAAFDNHFEVGAMFRVIIDRLEAMEKGEPQKDGAWLRERSAFVDAIAYACDTLRSVVPPDERDASLRDLAFMAAKSIRELTRERDEARAKLADAREAAKFLAKPADDWRQRCKVVVCKERGYSVQSPSGTHFFGDEWVSNCGGISAVGFWGSFDEARAALATAPPPPDWSEPCSTPAKPGAGDEAAAEKYADATEYHWQGQVDAFLAGCRHARGSK